MCCCFSCVRPFVTPWTVALQAPLSMGFSRQEWWSGLSRPLPGELPHPGIELMSLKSPVLTGGFFSISATWEAPTKVHPPLIVQKGGGLHGWQPLLHEPSTSALFTHPHWVIWDHIWYSMHAHTHIHTHKWSSAISPGLLSVWIDLSCIREKAFYISATHWWNSLCSLSAGLDHEIWKFRS